MQRLIRLPSARYVIDQRTKTNSGRAIRREWHHEDSETSVHIADFILVYIYNLIFLDNDCL